MGCNILVRQNLKDGTCDFDHLTINIKILSGLYLTEGGVGPNFEVAGSLVVSPQCTKITPSVIIIL